MPATKDQPQNGPQSTDHRQLAVDFHVHVWVHVLAQKIMAAILTAMLTADRADDKGSSSACA